jgi:hypothetical protein
MKEVKKLSVAELQKLAQAMYGDFIKGVVDIEKNILVLDMEMHVNGEQHLLGEGSKRTDLWGINLYPDKYGTEDFIEFDSMINIRPQQNNFSRSVEDPAVQDKIKGIVKGTIAA